VQKNEEPGCSKANNGREGRGGKGVMDSSEWGWGTSHYNSELGGGGELKERREPGRAPEVRRGQ